ncbi:MAG TPA: hypothetical protein VLR49_00490, partial [Ferruginibacter sp.]|nr:hypothetical protein [Ferruginibacter sp.]
MKQFLIYLMLMINAAIVSAQSVGIGTTTPSSSAILDLSSTSKGLLVPRMTTLQRNLIPAVGGLMVFDTDFKEYYQNDGTAWRKLLNSTFWNSSSTRSWIYNTTDSIGIGTSNPDEKLHISSGSIYLQDNRANKNPHVIFDIPSVDNNEAGLQFTRTGDTLASMNYIEDVGIANYIRLGVGAAGLRNDFTINTNGEIGIGSRTPM